LVKELQEAELRMEQASAALEEAIRQEESPGKEAKALAAGDSIDNGPQESATTKESELHQARKLGSSRGIETMFRSAYRVQMDLTGLADNKANMMISINGIIISIIIASVAPKLDANPWLLIPSSIFLLGNLVSVIFAILAARPRVSTQAITLEDLRNSEGNILFFGNFANMSEDDFVEGMVDLVGDKTVLYETMIRNIYGLGSVLKKKFALLQIAYSAFMVALILGVFSFLTVFLWILR
jgi:hypothetical protein